MRSGLLLLSLVAVLGAGSAAAAAREPTVTEYSNGLTLNNGAWDIVDGDDGRLWLTEDAISAFGPLSPGDGLITEFSGLLLLAGNPKGIAKGPDGNLWIAEAGLGGAIARVTKEGVVTEFTAGLTASDPWDIAAGPDGNLWFVSRSPAFIGRITPDGVITEFSAGLTPDSLPSAIAAGPDGTLWFTEVGSGRIGRITPEGVITEFTSELSGSGAPTDITAGPDGNLWFTLAGNPGGIGRITTDGEITEYRNGLTPDSRPTGIAAGTDGAVWFTESASPGRIGRISTSGGITEYTAGLTPDRAPWMITPGPDGNMWFTENANPGAAARISLPPLARTRDVGGAYSDNSALLPAKVRPNAQETEYHFEYGRGQGLNQRTATVSAGAGWDAVEVSIRIANLKPEKEYHYRVVATNGSGTTVGDAGSFTTQPLEPELGEVVVANPAGRVRFKRPGGRWRPLQEWGAELPVGVLFDTRRGSVNLTSADRRGRSQTGRFGGGVLQVRQRRAEGGLVDVHLRGGNFARCGRPATRRSARGGRHTVTASAIRRVRRLWGRDRGGRFRTHGRHSHATVRGTRWLTEDRCNGTLTRVTEGAVVVRDLARRRRVVVRAGHSYFARKPARAARR